MLLLRKKNPITTAEKNPFFRTLHKKRSYVHFSGLFFSSEGSFIYLFNQYIFFCQRVIHRYTSTHSGVYNGCPVATTLSSFPFVILRRSFIFGKQLKFVIERVFCSWVYYFRFNYYRTASSLYVEHLRQLKAQHNEIMRTKHPQLGMLSICQCKMVYGKMVDRFIRQVKSFHQP